MNRIARRTFLTFAATGLSGLPQTAENEDRLPSRRETLSLMHRVNDWQSAHPMMPPDDREWERGTWYAGIMSAWKETQSRKFSEQALDWGRRHQWQVGTAPGGANKLFCVETWVELYFAKKDPAMIEPAVRWLNTRKPNSPAGARRWYLEAWGWNHAYADSLFGAPALAMLAKATGDRKYLDILHAFFDDVTGELFDKDAGLYYRDGRFIGRRTASGRKVFWARANGWVFSAIARILEYLPENDSRRQEYVRIFRRMASELAARQAADGLWRQNLDDPEEIATPETSGSGFFCFGLGWGINHGILEPAKYLPAMKKAWAGLCRNVSDEGKVLWGQQVDDRPNAAGRESTHEYVTGAFLLAGSQVYRLVRE